ncbi:MAG: DASS family sodium-coupled anion symporter [Planctomycetota bacterium]
MKSLRRVVPVGLTAGLVCVSAATGLGASVGLSPAASSGLALLITAAIFWMTEAVPLYVTSIGTLALALLWIEPQVDVGSGSFTAPFASNVILLFLGGFTLSAGFKKLRIDEQVARAVLLNAHGSYPLLVAAIMVVTAFLSMWLSNTATAAMMIAIAAPLLKEIPEGDRAKRGLILSIPVAANIGGMGTPVGTPPNAIALQSLQQAGQAPTFGQWMLIGIPVVIVLLIAGWGVVMLMYRGAPMRSKIPEAPRVRRDWRWALVLSTTVLTVTLWLIGNRIGVQSGTAGLVPVILLFATGILDVRDFRHLPWDVLVLMGGGLCLGVVIEHTGLASWIVDGLPEGLSPLWIGAVLGSVACGLSCVMSNTAAANLLMPISIGLGVGFAQESTMVIALCCSCAMVLPVSTPPNAIAFSSGELRVRDIIGVGLLMTALGLALILTLGRWLMGVVLGG